jgi:hypothetical protein
VKKGIVPSGAEIAREAIIVIGGALLAALVVGQFPAFKAWLQAQWKSEP